MFLDQEDLMSHLARVNKLNPREVKWLIQVCAAKGYQSVMPFPTGQKTQVQQLHYFNSSVCFYFLILRDIPNTHKSPEVLGLKFSPNFQDLPYHTCLLCRKISKC